MSTIIEASDELKKLNEKWKAAKEAERAANTQRLLVEAQIMTLVGNQVEKSGTTHLGCLKIETGFEDKWNQDTLDDLEARWPHKRVPFPFRSEWKPNGVAIRGLAESLPDLYERLIPALTKEPKKPSFSLNGVSTQRDLKTR